MPQAKSPRTSQQTLAHRLGSNRLLFKLCGIATLLYAVTVFTGMLDKNTTLPGLAHNPFTIIWSAVNLCLGLLLLHPKRKSAKAQRRRSHYIFLITIPLPILTLLGVYILKFHSYTTSTNVTNSNFLQTQIISDQLQTFVIIVSALCTVPWTLVLWSSVAEERWKKLGKQRRNKTPKLPANSRKQRFKSYSNQMLMVVVTAIGGVLFYGDALEAIDNISSTKVGITNSQTLTAEISIFGKEIETKHWKRSEIKNLILSTDTRLKSTWTGGKGHGGFYRYQRTALTLNLKNGNRVRLIFRNQPETVCPLLSCYQSTVLNEAEALSKQLELPLIKDNQR